MIPLMLTMTTGWWRWSTGRQLGSAERQSPAGGQTGCRVGGGSVVRFPTHLLLEVKLWCFKGIVNPTDIHGSWGTWLGECGARARDPDSKLKSRSRLQTLNLNQVKDTDHNYGTLKFLFPNFQNCCFLHNFFYSFRPEIFGFLLLNRWFVVENFADKSKGGAP